MSKLIENWTTDLRYKKYNAWDSTYLSALTEKVNAAPWRLQYHIQPTSGLLNDPNGFSYFNGKWHLFYQAYPFGPVHGLKSWAHMTSTDLVHWEYEGIPLVPSNEYDSHGVYSGSALPIEDKLFLMYTGNVRDADWNRSAFQLGAWLDQEGQLTKMTKPLIETDTTQYTHDFRDPQIFNYGDTYLAIIGAQDTNKQGRVAVYQSENSHDWHYLGNLTYTDLPMGYMVECPNLVFIDEQPVLLFCPQGMDHSLLDYQTIYPNAYVLGSRFNKETLTIENPTTLQNLDEGFDVYATQAFNAPDGRALSVSWIGLPEIEYPTFSDGWAHCLSLVKELSIKDGHLYQFPVVETQTLRQDELSFKGQLLSSGQQLLENASFSYELELALPKDERGELKLFSDKDAARYLSLSFDTISGKLTVDRTQAGVPFAEEYGNTRSITIPRHEALKLSIFVDHSVCEIFINNGLKVITLRLFPAANQTQLWLSGSGKGSYQGKFWELLSQ